jgi:hypothetical protein
MDCSACKYSGWSLATARTSGLDKSKTPANQLIGIALSKNYQKNGGRLTFELAGKTLAKS